MQKIVLVPAVKEYKLTDKKVNFNKINYTELLSEYQNQLLLKHFDSSILCNLKFLNDEKLAKEAYRIDVLEEEINIYHSTSDL